MADLNQDTCIASQWLPTESGACSEQSICSEDPISPVSAEIPSESLLQVPVRSTPTMPSRSPQMARSTALQEEPSPCRPPEWPMLRRSCRCRPTSLPPIPPQGDGASGWSQCSGSIDGRSCGSISRSSSSRSSSSSSSSLERPVLAASSAVSGGSSPVRDTGSSHGEVANEEPLAQLPLRAWLRRAPIDGLDARGVEGPAHEAPGEEHGLRQSDSLRAVALDAAAPPAELASSWQVADELGHTGGMAAPRYLLVRLGECIPAETGAAPVHLSRLDTGPQWRDFLNYGEGRDPRGCPSLDDLLTCPCCLAIFRQPIALPCSHTLCRGCYARVASQPAAGRRCPLCRADLPPCDLRVNLALSAVCDSLRAFRAVNRPRGGHLFFE
mmetsp:Transcript_125257/g.365846  ORF Transcript_125257/g.365846 Transcript_125257/m.365846 type:complete len:383 (-) Transcript_125257:93-1241(-)